MVVSPISNETYKELKKLASQRLSALKNRPSFRLKFFGEKASFRNHPSKRQPLMFEDVQHLLMTALLGSKAPFKPERWCVLEKTNRITHTVILVIEGLTSYCFSSNESLFIKTKGIFEDQLEVILPKYEKNQILEELSSVPLTQSFKDQLIQKYGSLEAAISQNKDHQLISVFPMESDDNDSQEATDEFCKDDSFPRTQLLLSPLQMMIEGYPMPLQGEFAERYKSFKFSREKYKPVTSKSPMFGLDCEMCRTAKAENELARVSIVDENYESVYETLVRPSNPIIDYLTPWSGITKEMMEDVTKTLEQVQDEVRAFLPPDAILVGQSLNCDLSAMKIMHPYCIDTSVIFNITGDRNRKTKLQILAKEFLGEEIQMNKTGHSSIEDSTSSLKLTKLKLTKNIYFGDQALQVKKQVNESTAYTGIVETGEVEKEQAVASSLLSQAMKKQKKSAIITTENTKLDFGKFLSKNQLDFIKKPDNEDARSNIKHLKEISAKKVITKSREVVLDHEFNVSHFNILEDSMYDETKTSQELTELIPNIDKWIEKLWQSVASNGMFVVLFGGHSKNTNGVTMVRIKD